MRKEVELLAPAGNRERLDFALHYGADAVYCGTKEKSLRAFADNFSFEELADAARFVHEQQKKIYVTLNIFMRNHDVDTLPDYCREIAQTGVDAVIVSDPAALLTAKEAAPELDIHISTQANVLNYKTAQFWHEMGASRIILARELPIDQIRGIRARVSDDLELECFVHGAMCMSYSGRCMLSNYIDGRDGNRGACIQPCRWGYEMREMGKDGHWHSVAEDQHGTYLFNANDLNLIAYLQELIEAGITSLKIEGRMKTAFYVASVVNAYRMALQAMERGEALSQSVEDELEKIRHRPYTDGFVHGDLSQKPRESQQENGYEQTHEFVGVVLDYDSDTGIAKVQQRNRFFLNDRLEILSPGRIDRAFVADSIEDEKGNPIESACHPKQILYMKMPNVQPYDIVRKAI